METWCCQSILEILPDEILLEVCKYMLCVDILQAFVGLNSRITRMITQYCHHVSLHKATFTQSSYACMNVLPQIGSHIRSLVIDCCYSVLQDKLFAKYIGNKFSVMFPHIEKISLVAFQHDQLVAFLDTLHDLNHLVEIHLYSLFPIPTTHQQAVLRTLMQANNNQLKSVIMDDRSSCLSFHNTDCYVNILQLHINMRTVTDLSTLFAAVPRVYYLNLLIRKGDNVPLHFDGMNFSPLLYLTDLRLESSVHSWKLEELFVLFSQIPIVERLSLFLSTIDERLVDGNMLLPLLPSTVQQFNYAVYYYPVMSVDRDDAIVASWPSSHPIACFLNDTVCFIHTLPWHFARMMLLPSITKAMSSQANRTTNYYKQLEELEVSVHRNFILTRSLGVIAQCHRVRNITIWVDEHDDLVQEEHHPVSRLPKLSRLIQVYLHGSIPSDLGFLSLILIAAPNLCSLTLPIDYLVKLLENQHMCDLLRQRVTILSIKSATNSAQLTLSKDHIPIIASIFTRLRDLTVDLSHLPLSTTVTSNEDIPEDSVVRTSLLGSCQQKRETVTPLSTESMLLCLLNEFKEHKLTAIGVYGRFHERVETDAKQWLQNNTMLGGQRFDAEFMRELHLLVVWM